MELFGWNEYQWLVIVICAGGKRVGIGNTLDYMREKGLIDYDD